MLFIHRFSCLFQNKSLYLQRETPLSLPMAYFGVSVFYIPYSLIKGLCKQYLYSFFKPLILSALCVAFRCFIVSAVEYLRARTVQTECNQARLNCRGAARSRSVYTAKIRISEQKAKFYLNFFEREVRDIFLYPYRKYNHIVRRATYRHHEMRGICLLL